MSICLCYIYQIYTQINAHIYICKCIYTIESDDISMCLCYGYQIYLYNHTFDLERRGGGDICTVCCSVLQCVAVCCSLLQFVAVCCSLLQLVAVCCSVLQCAAVCCSVLQRVAVCCSGLQYVAVHCSTLIRRGGDIRARANTHTHTLACVNICFKYMSYVCTSAYIQFRARTRRHAHTNTHCTLQHTATHCNTLQHTATYCNILQHTATHCNTLQDEATRIYKQKHIYRGICTIYSIYG